MTLTFTQSDFTFDTINGYNRVSIQNGSLLTDPAKPMLPTVPIRIALPPNVTATAVKVTDTHEQTLQGTYTIYPAQPPTTMNSKDTTFAAPDPTVYQSTSPYPNTFITLTGQSDLVGQAMAELTVYPLRYVGHAHQLRLLTSVTLTIQTTPGYTYGDYLPRRITTTDRQTLTSHVKNMVINTNNVQLQTDPRPHTTGVPAGDYDYVIITSSSWVTAFQPLADWKTEKGVPATIVTTDWIYNQGGYTGTNQEKIRAFIQDAYTNWGATFFLLGGDTGTVPCSTRTFSSVDPDPVPNDTYYADFDSDWLCEVNVGRASVTGPGTGTGQIGTFINKILTYEKSPPLTNYATKAAMFGFDLDSSTHAEQCKITIDNTYIPASWTMTNVYDSQTGNHKTNVIAAINAGQNLMNHADHSADDYMGTGYLNHNWGLSPSDMDALNNGNKQGIFYSMGCDPCAFDASNCIAEHFVRDSNGGGIAFIGNSRYGWYSAGSYNTLSMKFDTYFFRSLFNQGYYRLGEAFTDHKNDAVNIDDYYRYIFTELTLLGDPELPIWLADPGTLAVNYPTQLPIGTTDFTVTVTANGSPVNQATVCLWKGSEVYLVGMTNENGVASFTPSPGTPGSMSVTVTKQNYLPSENTATVIVGDDNPPATPMKPAGATAGKTNVEYTYSTNTTDPDGDQVWYQWQFGSSILDWAGPFDSGATVEVSFTWVTPGTYDVKVKAKDTVGFQSNWSSPLTVTINEYKPDLTLGPLTGGFFGVATELSNNGTGPATNVSWIVNLTGGIILKGRSVTGTLDSLEAGTQQAIQAMPIIGLGSILITVTVKADDAPEHSKTATGFVFLFWVGLT